MNDEKSTGVLSWLKWWVSDANTCKATLSNEQMGELFFAVMSYVETSEKIQVSPAIQFPYSMFCEKVDSARIAYKNQSDKRAEAGRKGGKAKAKNAKKDSNVAVEEEPKSPVFEPPTKTEFNSIISQLKKEGLINCGSGEAIEFYQKLKEKGWRIRGLQIQKYDALKAAILARFGSYYISPETNYFLFEAAFHELNGDVDDWTLDEIVGEVREESGIDLAKYDELTQNALNAFYQALQALKANASKS